MLIVPNPAQMQQSSPVSLLLPVPSHHGQGFVSFTAPSIRPVFKRRDGLDRVRHDLELPIPEGAISGYLDQLPRLEILAGLVGHMSLFILRWPSRDLWFDI